MWSAIRRAFSRSKLTAATAATVSGLSFGVAALSSTTSCCSKPWTSCGKTSAKGSDVTGIPVTPSVCTDFPNKSAGSIPKTGVENAYSIPKESHVSYEIQPPVAMKIPTVTRLPWDTLVDNYAWLRDSESESTLSYLRAENTFTEARMKHTEDLQSGLYNEILGRIVEDDSEVPSRRGDYYYYTRTEKGKAYKLHCRSQSATECEGFRVSANGDDWKPSDESVLLDENQLAEGQSFLSVGRFVVAPNHKLLAFSTDTKGNEVYDLHFKDLTTGQLLPDKIENVASSVVFANDNKTLFYTKYDDSWRPYQLWMHSIGTDNSEDKLLLEESDLRFRVWCSRALSGDYLHVGCGSALTDEEWVVDANLQAYHSAKAHASDSAEDIVPRMRPITGRKQGVENSVTHHKSADGSVDELLVLTNMDDCTNFKLMSVALSKSECDSKRDLTDTRKWTEVIPHSDEITLQRIAAFRDFIVLQQRGANGLCEYRVRHGDAHNEAGEHLIPMPEPSYDVEIKSSTENLEYNADYFRFRYTSLVTPATVFDYRPLTAELISRKVKPVNSFDASNYCVKRVLATARDGTKVPISMIHRNDVQFPAPVLMTGYGSYGYPYDDYFSVARLSLVDRGLVVAFAHIRGGGEFGRRWKLDGRLAHKRNTFTDFIACAEHLHSEGFTDDNLQIVGRSAGGLLMGSMLNTRPELYRSVIADVPFVDCLNTILDASLPLTAGEWEEWGDPRVVDDYFYIKSYSPMENVSAMRYPHILLQGGLNDSRVKYWEPAKFCAKLRAMKTDSNELLLKTTMAAGHGGSSGRYQQIKEIAFEYAWVLDKAGLLHAENDLVPDTAVEAETTE